MAERHGLAQRRKTLGFSQEQFAWELRVDRTTVGRWERGETDPQPYIRPRLARALKVNPTELGKLLKSGVENGHTATDAGGHLPQEPLDSGTLDDMIRREFLRLVSVAGAIVTLPQGEVSEVESAIGADDLGVRSTLNSHLWSIYGLTSSKQSVYPLVREQLSTLTSALREARSDDEHRALCGMVGDVAQLAGEVWFDANRYTEAAHCYALAADAGKEAGDRDLWACALVRHSFVSLYARRYDDALPLLDAAGLLARNGDSQLPTRHWVASVRAQVFAGLGDADGCTRALDEAVGVQGLSGVVPCGWLRFTGDRLAEERGSAFVTLGRLDLAERALADALEGSLSPRRRGSVLTDLAVIGARRKDVDQLVFHGTNAVELAHGTGSGYIARRLQSLKDHLGPFRSDRRVHELAGHIEALGVRA